MTRRETVQGWRYDFLTPLGWFPSAGTREVLTGDPIEPMGWYRRERAVCLIADHHAPHARCYCGLHAIEELTVPVAGELDALDLKRAVAVADGRIPHDEFLVIALSRVRLTDVLPTAWPDDVEARASHPDAAPDPPRTLRAHRKEYLEVFVDRDWPSLPGGWPPEVAPADGVHYIPDLAAWVRYRIADEIEDLKAQMRAYHDVLDKREAQS